MISVHQHVIPVHALFHKPDKFKYKLVEEGITAGNDESVYLTPVNAGNEEGETIDQHSTPNYPQIPFYTTNL